MRRFALAAFVAAAVAAPARAGGPDPDDYVTVEFNPPVTCVTEPCDQPQPVTVCVVVTGYCTPR